MRFGWLAAAAATMALTAPAQAAVTYELYANSQEPLTFLGDQIVTGSLSVTLPYYLTNPFTQLSSAELSSCSASLSGGGSISCTGGTFRNGSDGFGVLYHVVELGVATGPFTFSTPYYFAVGAFTANGTYNTTLLGADRPGTLIVSGFAEGVQPAPPTPPTPSGPVPEPATWIMAILGFAAIGGALRRGRRHATLGYAPA